MYILSQIFGLLSLIITLYSYHLNKKEKIFKSMCIANIIDIIHYVFLEAYSGLFTKVVALLRNIFIIIKEKNSKLNSKILLFIFIALYSLLAILTFESYISLLPFIAAIVYMIVVWNGNELQVKKIAFLCYFLWLIYNISVLSIFGTVSNIVSLISTYIAYLNEKKSISKQNKYNLKF